MSDQQNLQTEVLDNLEIPDELLAAAPDRTKEDTDVLKRIAKRAEGEEQIARGEEKIARGEEQQSLGDRGSELVARVNRGDRIPASQARELGMLMQAQKEYEVKEDTAYIASRGGALQSARYDRVDGSRLVEALARDAENNLAVSVIRRLTGGSEDSLDCFAEVHDRRQAVYELMQCLLPVSATDPREQEIIFSQALTDLMQEQKTDDLSAALMRAGFVKKGEVQEEVVTAWLTRDEDGDERLAA